MKVYRVYDEVGGGAISARYFVDKARALDEAERLAGAYAALNKSLMLSERLDRYGIVHVWCDRHSDPGWMVKVEEGDVDDAA
jgi:hypothetical protein